MSDEQPPRSETTDQTDAEEGEGTRISVPKIDWQVRGIPFTEIRKGFGLGVVGGTAASVGGTAASGPSGSAVVVRPSTFDEPKGAPKAKRKFRRDKPKD